MRIFIFLMSILMLSIELIDSVFIDMLNKILIIICIIIINLVVLIIYPENKNIHNDF